MEKKITIHKVAELAGTSVSTVSRVLSNPWYPVAEETRERVAQAVKDSGYKGKPGSRYNKQTSNQDIGVIFPNLSNPFFFRFSWGFRKNSGTAASTCLCSIP